MTRNYNPIATETKRTDDYIVPDGKNAGTHYAMFSVKGLNDNFSARKIEAIVAEYANIKKAYDAYMLEVEKELKQKEQSAQQARADVPSNVIDNPKRVTYKDGTYVTLADYLYANYNFASIDEARKWNTDKEFQAEYARYLKESEIVIERPTKRTESAQRPTKRAEQSVKAESVKAESVQAPNKKRARGTVSVSCVVNGKKLVVVGTSKADVVNELYKLGKSLTNDKGETRLIERSSKEIYASGSSPSHEFTQLVKSKFITVNQ